MTAKPVRLYGDPILRRESEAVSKIDGEMIDLVNEMIATVEAANGLGLAAPQIGVSKRVIVVVAVDDEGRRSHYPLYNPEIVSACGEDIREEGCLSLPDIYADVKRPESVVVTGLDSAGRKVNFEASGVMARAFAHEIDHLDGILFIDRIGIVKRNLLRRKLAEVRRNSKEILESPR